MSKKRKKNRNRSGGGEGEILSAEGLKALEPRDAGLLKKEFATAGARAWCCFTPFLHFTSDGVRNQVYWRTDEGGVAVLYRKERGGGVMWSIYTLAVRDRRSAERAVELADRLNGGRPARMLWISEDQLEYIENIPGVVPEFRDEEYFYDTEKVALLHGPEFADVRKKINRFRREYPDHPVKVMDQRLAYRCHELHEKWVDEYHGRGYDDYPLDHFYTTRALEQFDDFGAEDFFGWAVMDGKDPAGFALAGEMTNDLANFFALKTDVSVHGLSAFLRWYSITMMHWMGYSLVNDASDLNEAGLERHKSKFRPVEKLKIYKVGRE